MKTYRLYVKVLRPSLIWRYLITSVIVKYHNNTTKYSCCRVLELLETNHLPTREKEWKLTSIYFKYVRLLYILDLRKIKGKKTRSTQWGANKLPKSITERENEWSPIIFKLYIITIIMLSKYCLHAYFPYKRTDSMFM